MVYTKDNMSKKNNNLREDISQLSQLDGQQVLKDIHSLPGRYARVSDARVLVPQYFDDVGIDYNSDGKVTEARYYVGTEPHITEITTVDDVAGSLQDSYIAISAGRLKERYVLHFTIDGVGSPPVLSGVKFVEVPLQSGDSAALIASAIKAVLSTYEQFSISQVSNNLKIKTKALGTTNNTVQVGTGFTVSNTSGARELVQVVSLEYSVDGHPVWQGQELKDTRYNPYTSKFETYYNQYLESIDEKTLIPTVSAENSTTTPLDSDEEFTGDWVEVLKYSNVSVTLKSNVMSADSGIIVEWSSDGVNVDHTDTYTINNSLDKALSFGVITRYFRVRYINSSNPQSFFRMQTILHIERPKGSTHRIGASITSENDAELVKAVQTGKNPNDLFVNARTSGYAQNNCTTTLLGAGGNFTGEWEDVQAYSNIAVTINADVDSALNGAVVEFSHDGVNVLRELTSTFTGNPNGAYFSLPVEARYFRINYTNGPDPQTKFIIETILSVEPLGMSTVPVSADIDDLTSTLITRSINAGKDANGVYRNERLSGIVSSMSSNTPLLAGEEYNSGWVDVSSYSTGSIIVNSDQDSAEGGLKFELSTDGVNVDEKDEYTYPSLGAGETGKVYSIPLYAQYFRVRYINGSIDQTEFRIQGKFFKESLKFSSHRINDPLLSEDDAELVKAVISAEDPEGVFRNIKSSGDGNLLTVEGQRPSEVLDRIRIRETIENVSLDATGTVLHTVTPGYTFYATSVIVSLVNQANAIGRFALRDGAAVNKLPLLMPERISGSTTSSVTTSSPPLPEPMEFETDVRAVELAGNITASVTIIGYEEPLAFQNLNSLSFDGVNEYINLASPASLNLSSNFSISAWFNTTNTVNNKCIIGKYGSASTDRSYFIELVGSSNVVRVYLYGAGGVVKDYRTPLSYNDGLWHNVTVTFASNDLKIYMDGVAITPTVVTDATVTNIQSNSSDTKIAALPLTGSQTNYFNGKLDEVSIYNGVLTPSEVIELYNSGDPIELSTSSFSSKLLSWYRMGDNTTLPNIIDVAPGGNDGTAVNMESGDIQGDVP